MDQSPLSIALTAGHNIVQVDFSDWRGRPVTSAQERRLARTLSEMVVALNARLAQENHVQDDD
jgi:hypothetical protein